MNRSTRLHSISLAAMAGVFFTAAAEIAQSQEWAKARLEKSPRHMEYATVKHGDREVSCFVAYPEVSHKAHAVVAIHDISGMGDWIRGVADQLAEAGYIAIVPDLVSGMGPNGGNAESFASVDDIRRAIPQLPVQQINADLIAAADYVRSLPAAKGTVSLAGFCWGGGQALRHATVNKELKAAFVFYGYEPIDADDVARVECPIYGFYAENDARINSTLPDVRKLMADAEKKFEPVTYNGAGHGFMRHGEDPAGIEANKQARDQAWVRWKELLKSL
jgi:carboxymethylenebutenolidase